MFLLTRFFVTDSHGMIRDANPRAAELFGYTQAEFSGKPIESLVPERFRGRTPSIARISTRTRGHGKWARL